jgi:hypothetical protein
LLDSRKTSDPATLWLDDPWSWLTAREYARQHSISLRGVQHRCATGTLMGYRDARGRWWVRDHRMSRMRAN